jgi:hypothetical protein
VLPFLPIMTEQLENAAPRPVTPELQRPVAGRPPGAAPDARHRDPDATYEQLRNLLERALNSQAVL